MAVANRIRPLNDELQKMARDELNEVVDRIGEDIATLRTWIEKQPHLKCRLDDQFLISFMRGCKYSLEKVKSKLDNFYTIKSMMPEVFGNNIMDEKAKEFCRTGICVRFPKSLQECRPLILLTNFSKFDPKVYSMMDLYRFQILVSDWQSYNDDNTVISGFIELVDLSKMSLAHVTLFEPMLVKKLSVFLEKGAPIRMKGVHIINCPKEAQTVLCLTRSLMSEKLQQRFYVHKTLDDLYKVIPKADLPAEYGGSNGTIPELIDQLEKDLVAFNGFFAENDQYGVNEKLRPGKKIDADSMFGIEGSFRKLDLD